ncbi:MAG: DUF2200 domain-containing protein [Pseudomonadota bacterium]
MTFASIYPHYVTKVEKKGKTREDLHTVIEWLTGYSDSDIQSLIEEEADFQTFFYRCQLNANVHLITGVICGYRVEEMDDGVLKKCRYLDKLVDELARGKKMQSILRVAK